MPDYITKQVEFFQSMFGNPAKIIGMKRMEAKDFLISALTTAYKEGKEEAVREAIALSDKIEMSAGDTVLEEWKAFKRFRNTLRDMLHQGEINK